MNHGAQLGLLLFQGVAQLKAFEISRQCMTEGSGGIAQLLVPLRVPRFGGDKIGAQGPKDQFPIAQGVPASFLSWTPQLGIGIGGGKCSFSSRELSNQNEGWLVLVCCLAEIQGEMLEATVAVQLLQLLIRKRQEWFRQLQWAWWADGHRTKEQWLRRLENSGKSLKIHLSTEAMFVKSRRPPTLVSVAFLMRPKLQQRLKRSLLGAESGIALVLVFF